MGVNKPVKDHLGKEYKSIREMAGTYDIKYATLKKRMSNGWDLERALTKPNRAIVKDHIGNEFGNIGLMLEHYQISKQRYRTRIESGWTLEEALTGQGPKREKEKKFTDHKGNKYASIGEMCFHWGIIRFDYYAKKNAGYTLEEILTTPPLRKYSSCKDHTGVMFPHYSEMALSWGISQGEFEKRMRNNWSLKDALETPTNTQKSRELKKIYRELTEEMYKNNIEESVKYNLYFYGNFMGMLAVNGAFVELRLLDDIPEHILPNSFHNKYYKHGDRKFNSEQVMSWILKRVAKPTRYDMDKILKEIGIEEYDALKVWLYLEGRFNDGYYITKSESK